jgi:SEC-C motif domain protein
MKGGNPPCPCGSGARYGACCRRFHRGDEPPDPVSLMRSRFAAFALGESAYLRRTLDPEHPDAAAPAGAPDRSLKYARLRVLDHDADRVLFHAEIYRAGKECSFAELSRFRNHAGAWRYVSGQLRPMRADDPELEGLTLRSFA